MLFFIFILTGILTLCCGEGSDVGEICQVIHKIVFWIFVSLIVIGLILSLFSISIIAIISALL